MSHRLFVPRQPLAALALTLLALPSPGPAQGLGKTLYVQASSLNVRSAPQPGASVIAPLRLNEPVEAQAPGAGSPWCAVSARGGSVRGWADCSLLGASSVTLERLGQEIATATLALHRQILPDADGRVGLLDGTTRFKDIAAARAQIERLFGLLERHFALSPSLHSLADYDSLLSWLLSAAQPASAEPSLRALAAPRLAVLARLRNQLAQLNTSETWPSARHSALATLGLVLNQRRPGSSARRAERLNAALASAQHSEGPAPGPSLFRDAGWVIGWAGGPLVTRATGKDPEGAVYRIRFNGNSYRALADLHEMLKLQRLPAQLRFETVTQRGEMSQTSVAADHGPDGLVIQSRLPVWAITADGLVAGTLRRASFGGDECSADEHRSLDTLVEVVFERPVRGDIHGLFATNQTVRSEKAVVSVRKRGRLAPLASDENTLTRRVDMQVDLDGDGVPDLRTVVSQDTAVGQAGSGLAGGLRRVAGWYANNLYLLQGNQDGWWRWLSVYNVQTCT